MEHGDCPPEGVDERVARSWRRSLAAGLLPAGRLLETEHASGGGLRHTLESNHDLLAHSRPVMEYLFEQVRHSQGMVILADSQGTLMHTLGHADFLGKAERVALANGASWHEQHRGTNAIGTALIEASGIEIHGAEHFFERNDFLTCTAVPILSAMGQLMGVIDISGDQRSGHPHTLGLLNMAASMIENRLLTATCQRHIRLHLHAYQEGIGSVAEGIIALSIDGWIVGANRAALALLHLGATDLGATPLARTMDVGLDELLARHKRRPGQATQVRLLDGSTLFVQVHLDATALPAAPAARVNQLISAPVDALARLDTGDLRWRNAADKARRVADKPIPVLIQGESGVGKELFARAVHESGPRRNGPFVAINCAALPENLIEAELFGYAPGAFTGARREGGLGRLREAHIGTLFLDEIGDMPLTMQTRLLRVLQERQVTPLGGGRPVDVDFALICATHCKLREMADQGRFRSDLYYRINGLTVQLPALRERTDFSALTLRLLANINPERGIHLAPDLLARLSQHPWPGNLRQYAGMLRTASAMLDPHEDCIDWSHLPDDVVEELTTPAPTVSAVSAPGASQNLDELSRVTIRQALESSCGNISQAARRLGISRQTLYRKLND
ncbi:MAG: sigma-54-dependent Fis family transcriptional regulator [Rhodoferax sp.]|nr:sigma-54-dependent Fis family transcriptional regulator [Rhodoferax sp.]NMM20838.1 sigma-54-dependent Fis family transcriptional regulator [Rhodoferax sp.]